MQNDSSFPAKPHKPRPLISRGTILILAVVLFAMGVGTRLSPEQGNYPLFGGCLGLSVYVLFELAAKYKALRQRKNKNNALLRKLDQILITDYTLQFVRREPTSDTSTAEKRQDPRAKHILVIDDEPQITKLIERMLSSEGISVRSCAAAEKALELARDAVCILCDAHLAGMGGADLVRKLRREGYSGPIIMISGDSARATVKESLDAGIDDYLVKPFEKDTLLQRVRRLLPADHDSSNRDLQPLAS